jgi:hypothetical protein
LIWLTPRKSWPVPPLGPETSSEQKSTGMRPPAWGKRSRIPRIGQFSCLTWNQRRSRSADVCRDGNLELKTPGSSQNKHLTPQGDGSMVLVAENSSSP